MTVRRSVRTGAVVLLCDDCGLELRSAGTQLRDWYVLWAVVQEGGWFGTAAPYGPHACPDCAARRR